METNKKLRFGVLAGIFLIPFIPFLVTNSLLFPFISGKNFAFRIIVELVFGLWLILCIRDRSYRPKKNLLLIAFGLFVIIVAVADFAGVNPFRSFWSNFERMDGLITQIHLLLYFLVLMTVLNTEKLWNYFFNTSITASLIMSAYGFLQLFGALQIHQGSTRLDATLGNSAYLAVYMLFHVFLILFLYLRTPKEKMGLRYFYAVAFVLEIIVLYYTATRGTILGFIGGMFLSLLLIAIFEKENKKFRKICAGVCIGLVIIVGGFWALRNTNFVANSEVLSRFSAISATEQTTESRFVLWNMAWQGVKEHPVLGWGQENFIAVFGKYYDPRMYNQEPWFDRAHNVFLDWLVSGGVIALVSYLSLFGLSLYCIWKKSPRFSLSDKAILTGLLAGYFFHNLFVFDNLVSYIYFGTFLAYFSYASAPVPPAEPLPRTTTSPALSGASEGVQSILIPLIIILIPLSLYFLNIPQIAAGGDIISALQNEQNNPTKALEYFKDSVADNTFAKGESREQMLQSATRVASSAESNDFKQTYALFADGEMQKQIAENPLDVRYPFFLGQFFLQFGLNDQAIQLLQKATEIAPKKQEIQLSLGVAYFVGQDYTKAFSTVQSAYQLEPDYSEARILYAAMALYDDKDDVAEKVLGDYYGTLLVPDKRILQSYIQNKVLAKFEADDAALVASEIKSGKVSSEKLAEIRANQAKSQDMITSYQNSLQAGQ